MFFEVVMLWTTTSNGEAVRSGLVFLRSSKRHVEFYSRLRLYFESSRGKKENAPIVVQKISDGKCSNVVYGLSDLESHT